MKKEFTIEEWRKDQGQKVVNNRGEEINPNEKTLGWLMVHKLYIVEEPELSEFEKGFQKIISEWQRDSSPFEESMSYLLHKDAAELLDLARKELNLTIGDYGQGYSAGYIDGKKEGKAEALKVLPRWREGLPPRKTALVVSGYDFICVNNKLLKLSSLEKLPGFND